MRRIVIMDFCGTMTRIPKTQSEVIAELMNEMWLKQKKCEDAIKKYAPQPYHKLKDALREILNACGTKLNYDLVNSLSEELIPAIEERVEASQKPYPFTQSVLDTLSSNKVRVFVTTNNTVEYAQRIIDENGLDVERVFGGDEGSKKKHPAKIAEFMGISLGDLIEQSIYIGDDVRDMKIGRQYGFFTIGVSYSRLHKNQLRSAGADRTIRTIVQIMKHLNG